MSRARSERRAALRVLFGPVLAQRGMLTLIIALSLASAGAALAQPALIGQVISRVQQQQPLHWLPGTLALIVITSALLSGLLHYLIDRTAESAVRTSRSRLVDHLLRLPIPVLDRRRTADLVSRVSTDTTTVKHLLSEGALECVAAVFTLAGALVAMLLIDPLLLGLAGGVSLLAIAVIVVVTHRIEHASLRLQTAVGEIASAVDRSLRGVRTLRVADATAHEAARVKRSVDGAWREGLKLAKRVALVAPVSAIAMQVSFLAVLGIGGLRVAAGVLTVAELVSFIMFLLLMVMPLGQIFSLFSAIGDALGGATRIARALAWVPEQDAPDARSGLPAVTDAAAVHFDRVSFGYAASDGGPVTEVLRDVSFTAQAGSTVAIVGPSGAGKSTILNLLARFYDPTAGRILVHGEDVRCVTRSAVRRKLALVEQQAPAISGTVRDNLLIGDVRVSPAELDRLLNRLGLTGVLRRSALGLDAQIGENGVLLSGGEKQRLALARALLRKPDVLLLDEFTSHLDGVTEERVQELLAEYAAASTKIVVAHRLATVLDADQILVLNAGRIVARGTHEELMAASSSYRQLALTQFLAAPEFRPERVRRRR